MEKNNSWFALSIVGLGLGLGTLVACNNGGGGSNNSTPPPVSAYGNPTPTCINGVCYYNYGTPAQYIVSTNVTFLAVSGTVNNAAAAGVPGLLNNGVGSMNLQSGFTNLLSEVMGICNRADLAGGSTGGNASCSAYTQGVNEVSFYLSGSSASTVVMRVRTFGANQGYYYTLPSWGSIASGFLGIPSYANTSAMTNDLQLQGTMAPINNSQGFEIRAMGPQGTYGYNRLIQLQVMSGSIASASVPFLMYYNSNQAASGTLNNCQSSACPAN